MSPDKNVARSELKFLAKHKISGKRFEIKTIMKNEHPINIEVFRMAYRTTQELSGTKSRDLMMEFFETDERMVSVV